MKARQPAQYPRPLCGRSICAALVSLATLAACGGGGRDEPAAPARRADALQAPATAVTGAALRDDKSAAAVVATPAAATACTAPAQRPDTRRSATIQHTAGNALQAPAGQTIMLAASARSEAPDPELTYAWHVSGSGWRIVSGATAQTLVLEAPPGPASTGSATVIVTDAQGRQSVSTVAVATSNPGPVIHRIELYPLVNTDPVPASGS